MCKVLTKPLKEQWQCADGECISVDDICDGRLDCLDGSDETHALCRKMRCPEHLFRCTYGACVSSKAPCDDKVDCADASDELSPICRIKSDEINGQYICTNGQLIPVEKRCDGIPHCKDGSDETVRSCANMTCHPYLFQCAYGACADHGADCNGIIDCADGSDEAVELCSNETISTLLTTTPVVEISSKCKLPDYPQYGTYTVVGFPTAVPGQILEKPIIEMSCNTGYALDSPNSMYCVDGTWSSAPPRCVRKYTTSLLRIPTT
ncbi:PREDICTED: very low-density lipoprotein receptor-like [Papilio polytes]|uniref:very low-density lipoprotein receptor-like n=1 Tax=Papilio polytes TaxID=76194 RepID=UPI0006768C9C|nr:PREDICTED: very low-density lipoprotein receptor-like [Papilio polytes]